MDVPLSRSFQFTVYMYYDSKLLALSACRKLCQPGLNCLCLFIIPSYTWWKNYYSTTSSQLSAASAKKSLPIPHLLLILHKAMQCNNARLRYTLVDLTEISIMDVFINIFVIGKYLPKKLILHADWPQLRATWQHSHGIFFFDSILHYKEWILMNYSDNGFVSYCFSVNLL